MDLNIVKVENDYATNNEIYIKTEPIDNPSEFLTKESIFTEEDHKHNIKTERFELVNIKCEDLGIKDEIACNPLDVGDHLGDLAHTTNPSLSKDIKIKEHYLEVAEEKLHESEEYGESSKRNQSSVKEKIIDPNENRFKCDECGKTFYFKNNLKVHLRIHFGEKPYKCCVCEKLFSHKNNLNRHMLIHTGEKPHKCDLCNKTFNEKSNFLKHKLVHSGYRPHCCDQCEQKFSHKKSLINHKRVHSGEKPYKCDVCEKAFAEKSNLTRHNRVHIEEKAFTCDICTMSFRYRYNLHQHKKRIHKNE